MSRYKGYDLISGVATVVDKSERVGQLVQSAIPLTDAGLHLLDGTLIPGTGIYTKFVEEIGKLYRDEEVDFIQPRLSANGVLGGNYFACSASTQIADSTVSGLSYGAAHWAFDGSNDNAWHGEYNVIPADLIFYNPKPIKVTKLTIGNWTYSGGNPTGATAGSVYGSNDGVNWVSLKAFTNSTTASGASWDIDITNPAYYSYYKITVTSTAYTGYAVIGEVTITGKIKNTSAYFIDEYGWQRSVTRYGSCGKFVYTPASGNNPATVRLPKVSDILQGTTDVNALGDLIEAGLPNLVGSFAVDNADWLDGILFQYAGQNNRGANGDNGYQQATSFNASRYNSIYGNSTTVQPQTIKVLIYIVTATSVKTDIEVDIDEIVTDLNGKADRDLVNITSVAENTITSLVLPDYKNGVTLSLAANVWRTVDKNVYLLMTFLNQSQPPNLSLKDENGTLIPSSYGNNVILASNLLYFCFGVFVPKGYSYSYNTGTAGFTEYPMKGAS